MNISKFEQCWKNLLVDTKWELESALLNKTPAHFLDPDEKWEFWNSLKELKMWKGDVQFVAKYQENEDCILCMLRLKGTLRANFVFFRGIRLAENERVTLIVGLFSSKSAY